MSYKPYPKYKDSGIEWLGEIPEGWNVKPLKRILMLFNGATPKSSETDYWDGNIFWATPDDLGTTEEATIVNTKRKITILGYESCGTTLVPKNSLILSTRAPIGHLGVAGVDICTNQGCKSLVFIKEDNTLFYYYLLLTARSELESLGQGTTFKELSAGKLAVVPLTAPPKEEQLAIASFLNRETEKIDNLIAKKERQIELLQEKRTALISHAVTKGLDPIAKMKDSGIEWLGEIPEGWNVKPLKRILMLFNGATPKSSETDYWDGNIFWATPDDLGTTEEATIVNTKRKITILGYESCGTTLVPKNSLILSTRAPIGHLGVAGVDICTNQGCKSLVFIKEDNTLFYYYLLLTARSELESLGQGTTFKELSAGKLAVVPLTAPPKEEQLAIASFLNRETEKIDKLIAKVQESIDKLKEYRQALISAAVTGKIDVREEAA